MNFNTLFLEAPLVNVMLVNINFPISSKSILVQFEASRGRVPLFLARTILKEKDYDQFQIEIQRNYNKTWRFFSLRSSMKKLERVRYYFIALKARAFE